MANKLSDHASAKCKPRVQMLENKDKNACIDTKTKRGVAMCVGHSILKQGGAKNISEALKKGYQKVNELCGD